MAGISDKALKTPYAENKYRYNYKELQNQEFSDGSGLDEYDYGFRFYDQQIGRWNVIDPLSTSSLGWSCYSYGSDNPIRFFDLLGLSSEDGIPYQPLTSVDIDPSGRVKRINADGDPGVYMVDENGRNLVGFMDPNHTYHIGEKYQYYGKPDYYDKYPTISWLGMTSANPNDPNKDQNNDKALKQSVMGETLLTIFFSEIGEFFGGGAAGSQMLLSELNPEELEELANEIVELNKATEGGGSLLSGTPSSALNTASYYVLPSEQAASVFRTIISNHMFVDGNKRTAVMALEMLGKKMGLNLVSQNQLLEVAGKVATGVLEDVEQVSQQIISK